MKRAMRWFRAALLLLAFHAVTATAIESFVIRDIRVEGIQRTEAGTIFSYLPVKVGDTMTDEKAAQAIRALFATGFFRDVSLEREGEVLVVVVQERPSIAQIEFSGLKEFEKDQITSGMRQIGIAEGRILDRGLLDRAEQELKRQYLGRGYYAVSISTRNTLRPPKRSVSRPRGRRASEPVSTGVAANRPNCVSLSWSSSLIGTPSTANIIQTIKHTVKASVLMPSTKPCRTRGWVTMFSSQLAMPAD